MYKRGVHAKLPQAHEKVCNENERNKERKKKKRLLRKKFCGDRKDL